MNIHDIRVDWMLNWANFPTLSVFATDVTDWRTLRYRKSGEIYYAEASGYVSYFWYRAPGEGFGRRKFLLTMEDGSVETLIGPWQCSTGEVAAAGFEPCMDISLVETERGWKEQRGFSACSATVAVLQLALDHHMPDVTLQPWTLCGKEVYVPTLRGMDWETAKNHMKAKEVTA